MPAAARWSAPISVNCIMVDDDVKRVLKADVAAETETPTRDPRGYWVEPLRMLLTAPPPAHLMEPGHGNALHVAAEENDVGALRLAMVRPGAPADDLSDKLRLSLRVSHALWGAPLDLDFASVCGRLEVRGATPTARARCDVAVGATEAAVRRVFAHVLAPLSGGALGAPAGLAGLPAALASRALECKNPARRSPLSRLGGRLSTCIPRRAASFRLLGGRRRVESPRSTLFRAGLGPTAVGRAACCARALDTAADDALSDAEHAAALSSQTEESKASLEQALAAKAGSRSSGGSSYSSRSSSGYSSGYSSIDCTTSHQSWRITTYARYFRARLV